MVADFLRAQQNAATEFVQVRGEVLRGLGAERQRRGRGEGELAGLDHLQHAVLQHLGVGGHVVEGAFVQARQHGIGDVAHARLQRQQVGGQAACLHFVLEEVDHVLRNEARVFVGRREGRIAVVCVGLHDGNDFFRIAVQVRLANAVMRRGQHDGLAVRGQARAVIDVVHAFQARALPVVHFQNHVVGNVQPGFVVADRGGGNQAAIGQDACHFNHGHVQAAKKAGPGHGRHVRQVHV